MSQFLKEMQINSLVFNQKPANRRQRRAAIAQQRLNDIERFRKEIAQKTIYRVMTNIWETYVTSDATSNATHIEFFNVLEELFPIKWLIRLWTVHYERHENSGVEYEGLYCNLKDLIALRKNKPVYWPDIFGSLSDHDLTVEDFLTLMAKMSIVYSPTSGYGWFNYSKLIKILGDLLNCDLMAVFNQILTKWGKDPDKRSHYMKTAREIDAFQNCNSYAELQNAIKQHTLDVRRSYYYY